MTRDEDGEIHVVMNRCSIAAPSICQDQRGNSSSFPMLVSRLDLQQ